MNDFYKAAGFVLICTVLSLVLSGNGKHFSIVIIMAMCAGITIAAIQYIQPVLSFFRQLQTAGNWNTELFVILMKSVGIGVLAQITALICADSGNSALGKSLQLMASAVILWLSLPLFEELLRLINMLLAKI